MARKKTERVYQPITSMSHFAEKLAGFGDSTAFRYYDHDRKLTSITYEALSNRIKQQAAGYAVVVQGCLHERSHALSIASGIHIGPGSNECVHLGAEPVAGHT